MTPYRACYCINFSPAALSHMHIAGACMCRKCFGGSACYERAWLFSVNLGLVVFCVCPGRSFAHLSCGIDIRSRERLSDGGGPSALPASSSAWGHVVYGEDEWQPFISVQYCNSSLSVVMYSYRSGCGKCRVKISCCFSARWEFGLSERPV